MPKEWILNKSTGRFQLNFKKNVGATSESIRLCSPKTVEEWRDFYYTNIRPKEHLEELGRKLYIKITEVVQSEMESITEQDCIDYIINLVINRTFEGYVTEITTVYGQLEKELAVKIEPASDDWDRKYNVDFFIKVCDKYIGLQIKPISSNSPSLYNEKNIQEKSHKKFTDKFGGNVFYVYSVSKNRKKVIVNTEVIDEIRQEIERLNNI